MTPRSNDSINILDFFSTVNKLKDVARAGWPFHGVPNGESVADHSFQVAIMAMFLAPKAGVDQTKSVIMALIHDIGESLIGDEITEHGDLDLPNSTQKQTNERNAIQSILNKAGMNNYLEIFDEFEENKTPEAQFVKQLDKLETAIQARQYEILNGLDLSEFYVNAKRHVTNPILVQILIEVIGK